MDRGQIGIKLGTKHVIYQTLASFTWKNNIYCRFSYAETWVLLNLLEGAKLSATIFVMRSNQVKGHFQLKKLQLQKQYAINED